ncbi:juvenile hormone esterase-like [Cochliomyia hominivorax]
MDFLFYSTILSLTFGVYQIANAGLLTHVCTPYCGCYNGIIQNDIQINAQYVAFLGIRYAEQAERFEPPVPYNSDEEHDATKPGFDCIQKNYFLPSRPVIGSEDCLFLNVYTKLVENSCEPLQPVMVYIYGGGFFSGSSDPIYTGPEFIMDTRKVVLVTLNYRLGAFGFMATEDGVIPGNLGLKDQNMALQWVQENIEYFGGDWGHVTLFGQGAGAISAHLQMLSPQSVDLFDAVIAMSGTALSPFAIDLDPDKTARKTAQMCMIPNWNKISTKDLYTAFKSLDVNVLLNAADKLKYWDVDNLVIYKPMIERPGPRAFLYQNPVDTLRRGQYKALPFMLGHVEMEGAYRVAAIMESDTLREEFNENFYYFLVNWLDFPKRFSSIQIYKKMEQIVNEYLAGEKELNEKTLISFLDMITDRMFYHPLYNTIKMYVQYGKPDKIPIYLYYFDFKGPLSYADVFAGNKTKYNYGVAHRDDLIYTFTAKYAFPKYDLHTRYMKAVKCFTEDLAYFGYFKKPREDREMNPCNKETFNFAPGKTCEYVYYTMDSRGFISIQNENSFNTKRMSFWDNILEINYFEE